MTKRTLDSFFVTPESKRKKTEKVQIIDIDESPPRVIVAKATKEEPIELDLDDEIQSTPKAEAVAKSVEVPVLSSTGFSLTSGHDLKPSGPPSRHPSYPFPIPSLPSQFDQALGPSKPPRMINDDVDLDLVCYEPYMAAGLARIYGEFLRKELPFYRVQYKINRFGKETEINTPRYTTVFGIDDTSRFSPEGEILDTRTGRPALKNKYKTCQPRPIPQCLRALLDATANATGTEYNFALVNYYASGQDSISFHSDDEGFLEKEPAIASFSFLGTRDFLLRHKPRKDTERTDEERKREEKPMKFVLTSGTLILMK
jgi:hypothetical protein